LKFKLLIDDIVIDFLFSENFASMEDIRRKCNLIVDLSIKCERSCSQTFSFVKYKLGFVQNL